MFFRSKIAILLLLNSLVHSFPIITERTDGTSLKNTSDYLVSDLPGLENIPETQRPLMHAGHIALNEETNYFFWKFQKKDSELDKLIIWLNGGPGCSSMDGALMESGPLRVDGDGGLYLNNGSWHEAADIIFVDQPGGTGFSTTKSYDKNLGKVSDDFIVFLTKYFESFPEDLEKDLFIAGESYAGQYIPYVAKYILDSNSNNNTHFNLQGLLIGNGWIAPNIQSLSYIPYSLEAGLIDKSADYFPHLLKAQERCQNLINSGTEKDSFSYIDCEGILTRILQFTRNKTAPADQECLNMYDTTLRDSYPSCGMNWPSDLDNVTPYLRNKDVVKSLNLDIDKIPEWRECDGEVSKFLLNKDFKPSYDLLPGLLEKIPILLFNGDRDIICNNRGVLDLISGLEWGGSKGFSEIEGEYSKFDWKYADLDVGTITSSKNLTFISVNEASHMVPFDKPFESRGIFDIFIGNFDIVESSNSSYVRTPVYSQLDDSDDENGDEDNDTDGDDNKKEAKTKSILPFLFYLGTILLIGAGLYHFKKGKKHSIMRKEVSQRKPRTKKSVSWADENETINSDGTTNESKGNFGSFFNNFTPNGPTYNKLNRDNADDDYEDIELQSTSRSDDTDFDFDIDDEVPEAETR